jgi:hypothetical protein
MSAHTSLLPHSPPPFSLSRYFLPSPFPDCLYFNSLISHDLFASSREHYEYHAARYLPIPPLLKAHHVSIPSPSTPDSRAMESSWCSRTADLHCSESILRQLQSFYDFGRWPPSGVTRGGQHGSPLRRSASCLLRGPAWDISQGRPCCSSLRRSYGLLVRPPSCSRD